MCTTDTLLLNKELCHRAAAYACLFLLLFLLPRFLWLPAGGCRACFAAGGGLGGRRTQDKKKTLLHVLMSWAKDKEPDLLRLDEDLEHVSEASQWSLTDLKQQVKRQGRAVYVAPRSLLCQPWFF